MADVSNQSDCIIKNPHSEKKGMQDKEIIMGVRSRKNKKSAEGVIAPAGAKVTGATIRMWLLNNFISFLAVLSWKTGLKKNEDKVPSGAHIFQASAIPSNGCIFSTDFSYYTAQ